MLSPCPCADILGLSRGSYKRIGRWVRSRTRTGALPGSAWLSFLESSVVWLAAVASEAGVSYFTAKKSEAVMGDFWGRCFSLCFLGISRRSLVLLKESYSDCSRILSI